MLWICILLAITKLLPEELCYAYTLKLWRPVEGLERMMGCTSGKKAQACENKHISTYYLCILETIVLKAAWISAEEHVQTTGRVCFCKISERNWEGGVCKKKTFCSTFFKIDIGGFKHGLNGLSVAYKGNSNQKQLLRVYDHYLCNNPWKHTSLDPMEQDKSNRHCRSNYISNYPL